MTAVYVNADPSRAYAAGQRGRELKALGGLLLIVIAAATVLTVGTSANVAQVSSVATRFLAASLFLAALLCLAVVYVQRRHASARNFDRNRAMGMLMAALLVGLTIPVFGIFKQLVLPLRGFPLDPMLRTIDQALFLGVDPWRLSHSLLPSLAAIRLLDQLYTIWMPIMFAFPMLAILAGRTELERIRLVSAWLAAWILVGGLGAWLLGSAGPCYYNALVGADASFAELVGRLAQQAREARDSGLPVAAIDFQSALVEAYRHGGYAPAGGISAAPSMHVAMAVLFAIGGFTVNRWLGGAMTVFAAAIWVGSVHLGWHYAIDGLISLVAMLMIWSASAPLARWLLGTVATRRGIQPRA
jgi:hypothetical protein